MITTPTVATVLISIRALVDLFSPLDHRASINISVFMFSFILPFVPPQLTINPRRYSFFVNTVHVFLWNSVHVHILNDPNPKSFQHSLYHYVC